MTQSAGGFASANGSDPAGADRAVPRDILTFRLGAAEYGVDIRKVQEIRGYDTVKAIDNAPEFIRGVIDLRGTIVPIIDPRIKFKLARAEYDPVAVVIISNSSGRAVGIAVDSVADVLSLPAEHIRAVPGLGAAFDTSCFAAMATFNGRMFLLVDLDRLTAGTQPGFAEQSVH